MSDLEMRDRQALWVWSMLGVVGALLAIIGWWRFVN